MKLLSTTFIALLFSMAAFAQEKIIVTQNVPYDEHKMCVMDIAQPVSDSKELRPAIVIVHGGGWGAGDKRDAVYTNLLVRYAMKGYVTFSVNYRLISHFPTADDEVAAEMQTCISDVENSVAWIKAHAKEYGVDATRIGTFGHSAGGHLSLMLGVKGLVTCAVGGAPPTEIGNPNSPWSKHPEWWPIGYIKKDTAPMLILQGSEDPVVKPNLTKDFVEKMHKVGNKVEYIEAKGHHGFAYDQALDITLPAMDAFYAKHLNHEEAKLSCCQELRIEQKNGKSIYGVISYPDASSLKGKAGIAIISHGFNGTHHFGKDYFKTLNDLGYAVYTFDFPCGSVNSQSDNNTMEMSITGEKEALKDIVAYFQKQKNIDKNKIVLVGESQGGLVSALAASELKQQVSNLVLIYPALCIPDNWNARYPRVEDIPEVSEIWGVKLGKKFMMDIRPMKPFETIGNYKGNVLIVHGTDDMVVPIEYAKRAEKTYDNATLKIIEKAGHGFNPEERELSNQFVKEFLQK